MGRRNTVGPTARHHRLTVPRRYPRTRPTVPTASLGDIVSLLFMDSIAENIDGTRLRDLIEAVIIGLSTPTNADDA